VGLTALQVALPAASPYDDPSVEDESEVAGVASVQVGQCDQEHIGGRQPALGQQLGHYATRREVLDARVRPEVGADRVVQGYWIIYPAIDQQSPVGAGW